MATPLLDVVLPASRTAERLDRLIPALCPTLSRLQARRMIDGGSVFVDGQRTGICSRPVRGGQRLTCYPLVAPRHAEEPRIVLERPDLLVVDKPAGMAVEPTRSGSRGTLVRWLERQGAGQGRAAHVTHRLDAPVSGLLVVACTKPAQADLNRLFAAHAVRRLYLAAVAPPPTWDDRVIEGIVDRKPARTRARVVGRGESAALLEIELDTGRFRQIRRHLAAAGMPVIGDREQSRAHEAGRILLHAFALSFDWQGTALEVESPPPADFQREVDELRIKALP